MSIISVRLGGRGALLAPTRRLLRGVERPFVVLVASSMLAGLGQAMVLAIVVQVALHLTDSALIDGGTSGLLAVLPGGAGALIVTGVAAIVAIFLLETANAFLQARIGSRVLHRLRTRLYDAYADATVEAQHGLRSGELAQLLTVNGAWSGTATLSAANAAVTATTFLTLGIVAAAISPLPTIGMGLAVGLVLFLVRPIARRSRGVSTDMAGRNTDLTETTGLAVELSDVIRTTGVEADYTASVHRSIDDLSRYWGRVRFLARLGPALFRNTALLLVFGAISAVYLLDVSSLAALGTTMLILIRSLTYVQGFQSAVQDLHSNLPWIEEIWRTVEELDQQPLDRAGVALDRFGPIEFAGVGLTYPNGTTALRDVNARIEPGEVVGVIGPSGAGKSSLAQLLLRLRTASTGTIWVADQDLAAVDLTDWTDEVAFVPQDARLLPATAAQNIAFFRDVDHAEIEAAATAAGIHDELLSLPDGYDTLLETGDTRLSGGQRQRLALARALVTRPSLLVLDEPTSALDLPTEALVAEAIAALAGETTVVVIAHRLSSLVHCDRLIVVEDGRVTATGRPDELLDTNAFYRDAVRLSEVRS